MPERSEESIREQMNLENANEAQMERIYETLNLLEKELATGDVDEDELELALMYLVSDLHNLRTNDVEENSLQTVAKLVRRMAEETPSIDSSLAQVGNRVAPGMLETVGLRSAGE